MPILSRETEDWNFACLFPGEGRILSVIIYFLPLNANMNAATCVCLWLLNEGVHTAGNGVPLDGKSSHQHVERNTPKPIATKESHQKPKSDEDHNVDILENCEK